MFHANHIESNPKPQNTLILKFFKIFSKAVKVGISHRKPAILLIIANFRCIHERFTR